MSYYEDERYMVENHGLRYIWECRQCKYQYESEPGYNEALPCPYCGSPMEKSGESYFSD